MSTYCRILTIVLAATFMPWLIAENRCPGNAASLRYSLVNGHQMTIAVSINHSGPFSFLLDTGSQVTVLDPTLAAELHLNPRGETSVVSLGFSNRGFFAPTDMVEAGNHSVANLKVLVSGVEYLRNRGIDVRGILGEDFLDRFDLLIDNHHKLVCLDGSNSMRAAIRGPWIPLLPPPKTQNGVLPTLLVVPVQLSDGLRPLRLLLDSGASVPILYSASTYMSLAIIWPGGFGPKAVDGRRSYTMLPPQDVRIGAAKISQVSFVDIAGSGQASSAVEFDGILSIGLFRRAFINHADRLVALEAW